MVESRTIYSTKQRSRAKILEFYPAQTEPKIYLQICYPSPTEVPTSFRSSPNKARVCLACTDYHVINRLCLTQVDR
jgi:hypothetical protein